MATGRGNAAGTVSVVVVRLAHVAAAGSLGDEIDPPKSVKFRGLRMREMGERPLGENAKIGLGGFG